MFPFERGLRSNRLSIMTARSGKTAHVYKKFRLEGCQIASKTPPRKTESKTIEKSPRASIYCAGNQSATEEGHVHYSARSRDSRPRLVSGIQYAGEARRRGRDVSGIQRAGEAQARIATESSTQARRRRESRRGLPRLSTVAVDAARIMTESSTQARRGAAQRRQSRRRLLVGEARARKRMATQV